LRQGRPCCRCLRCGRLRESCGSDSQRPRRPGLAQAVW
jgi:hypothetical protein